MYRAAHLSAIRNWAGLGLELSSVFNCLWVKSIVFAIDNLLPPVGYYLPMFSLCLSSLSPDPQLPQDSVSVPWEKELCIWNSPEWRSEALLVSLPSCSFCLLSWAWFSPSLCPDSENVPRKEGSSWFQFFLERHFPFCKFSSSIFFASTALQWFYRNMVL